MCTKRSKSGGLMSSYLEAIQSAATPSSYKNYLSISSIIKYLSMILIVRCKVEFLKFNFQVTSINQLNKILLYLSMDDCSYSLN